MGAGASAAEGAAALREANSEDLQSCFAALDGASLERLQAVLGSNGTAESPAPAAAEAGGDVGPVSGIAVVGENEDNVDDQLAFDLREQEMMFIKMMRKRTEREAAKKLEKEERKKADEGKRAKALEHAFEGELDSLLAMFDEGVELECCDQHGTSLLSEAAAGGHSDLVTLLLAEGANPNSLGRYRRTPLWRAAYGGSAATIQSLLRGGGDPREYDEQGQKPIDVCPNVEGRNFLMSWDTSATDQIKKQANAFAMQKKKNEAKEAKEKQKAQRKELTDAVEEAERRHQIAKVECSKKRKLAQNLRAQKISFAEQGMADKVEELGKALERAEMEWNEAEKIVTDLEWKLKRVQLKQRDWESEQKRKQASKDGKLQGFRVEHVLESQEDLDALKELLTMDLELKKELTTASGMILKPGDVLIKDGILSVLRDKGDFKDLEIEEWPLTVEFNHGFDTTIQIKHVSDTLVKDVGDKRKSDGRWPLCIDPSGKTVIFLGYSSAFMFTALDMKDSIADAELAARVRSALLKALLHGGCFFIDLQGFDFPVELLEDAINNLEKGLWAKLTDRSVLYSYLLTRRFMRLITDAPTPEAAELKKTYHEPMFTDENLFKFTFGFITKQKEPDLEFAKLFYTIRVKDPGEEEAA
eukprot:TRINITY_DN62789_c0_g1_i1.p1 TRINITY_DN62789_c0_g1~~TRINITY_DN62789_c0_g1_i1.p1  ORF type:complete len:643 (-),score=221.15 TRINITY_DN62789_c0_g1_i1:240-2168(-)